MRKHAQGRNGFEKLNLSDSQKVRMKAINEDFRKQMADLESKETITVKEQRDSREAIKKARKEKMHALLTAEQKAQLSVARDEAKKRREGMADKRLETLKEKLNLSDAQVSTIKSKQETTKSKLDAVLKNDSIGSSEKREQIVALRQEMKSNIESVLTPDQKSKMEEFRQNKQGRKDYHGEPGMREAIK